MQFFISSLISPDGSAPAALANLLFDRPEPKNIGKQSVSRLFCLFFRAPASSFFWLFLFSDLRSSTFLFSDPSHLCFSSVHIVGSLTSKLSLSYRHLYIPLALIYCFALESSGVPGFKCTLVGPEAWCSRFMSSAIGIGVEQSGSKHGLLKI